MVSPVNVSTPFSNCHSAIIIIAMLGTTMTGRLSQCIFASSALNSGVPPGLRNRWRASIKFNTPLTKNDAATSMVARRMIAANAVSALRSFSAASMRGTSMIVSL